MHERPNYTSQLPSRAASMANEDVLAASTSLPDNEVPLRKEGHVVTLKEVLCEGRITKDLPSDLEFLLKQTASQLVVQERHVYLCPFTSGPGMCV